jgi:hypothetical protein
MSAPATKETYDWLEKLQMVEYPRFGRRGLPILNTALIHMLIRGDDHGSTKEASDHREEKVKTPR